MSRHACTPLPAGRRRGVLMRGRGVHGLTALGLVVALGATSLAAAAGRQSGVETVRKCATVGEGAVGPAVATIQRVVKATPDGEFGPLTRAALVAWQRHHDLKPTGVVGTATWAALPDRVARTACGQSVHGSGVRVSCATLHLGTVGPAVEVLQQAIGSDVDGEFGPLTEAAVRTAQRKAKLPVSGIAGPATWAALGLTGTPACMAPGATPASDPPAAGDEPTAQDKAQRAIETQVRRLASALVQGAGASRNPIALRAMAFASVQKGKPYAWGGAGPASYDCSGLTMAAYVAAGLTIPRVAADQYAGGGTKLPLDAAQQGDLLFYASDLTRPETIYHVVMYVGHGQVLDAPHTGAYVGTRALWTQHLLPVAVRPVGPLRLPVRYGDTGWAVSQLQGDLNRHGAELTVDGGYGPQTARAVRAWKSAHKLGSTTRVGRATWLTLGAKPARVGRR